MPTDLSGVVVDKMSDTVVRNAAELGPFAQGANGRLLTGGKYSAQSKADNVGELALTRGGNYGCLHALACPSTPVGQGVVQS